MYHLFQKLGIKGWVALGATALLVMYAFNKALL